MARASAHRHPERLLANTCTPLSSSCSVKARCRTGGAHTHAASTSPRGTFRRFTVGRCIPTVPRRPACLRNRIGYGDKLCLSARLNGMRVGIGDHAVTDDPEPNRHRTTALSLGRPRPHGPPVSRNQNQVTEDGPGNVHLALTRLEIVAKHQRHLRRTGSPARSRSRISSIHANPVSETISPGRLIDAAPPPGRRGIRSSSPAPCQRGREAEESCWLHGLAASRCPATPISLPPGANREATTTSYPSLRRARSAGMVCGSWESSPSIVTIDVRFRQSSLKPCLERAAESHVLSSSRISIGSRSVKAANLGGRSIGGISIHHDDPIRLLPFLGSRHKLLEERPDRHALVPHRDHDGDQGLIFTRAP